MLFFAFFFFVLWFGVLLPCRETRERPAAAEGVCGGGCGGGGGGFEWDL